jgi:N-acetyl-alpha-D-muramate 1-phosphate uridylyltransferase
VRVGGKTLLDWALDQVSAAGIKQAVVNTSYLYEQVEAHVRTRTHPNVMISRETPVPLETGGGIFKALPHLGAQPFIVLNSDTICMDGGRPALERLWEAWELYGETIDFLMLMQPLSRAVGFYNTGDFIVNLDGTIRRPTEGEVAPYVFTGIEIIHPRVFVNCPQGAFSLNHLWNRSRGDDGIYSRIRAVIHDGDWLHVGDAKGLADVTAYFECKH